VGQVRRKIFIQHKIVAILPSTYQNLLNLVEIWRTSDGNKNAQFFRDTVQLVRLRVTQVKMIISWRYCVHVLYGMLSASC